MQRQRLKTGKFGLGTMIHSVHMTDDAARLNPEVLAADPADTFGAPYFFTATTFADDPFA